MPQWLMYALLSALCAAFVSLFGKIGLAGLDSTAATTIRSVIMALFLVMLFLVHGSLQSISHILAQPKPLLFIILSGIAGASSWLFYFIALKTGPVSQVAPIDKLSVVLSVLFAVVFLGEHVSLVHGIAIACIAIGGLLLVVF